MRKPGIPRTWSRVRQLLCAVLAGYSTSSPGVDGDEPPSQPAGIGGGGMTGTANGASGEPGLGGTAGGESVPEAPACSCDLEADGNWRGPLECVCVAPGLCPTTLQEVPCSIGYKVLSRGCGLIEVSQRGVIDGGGNIVFDEATGTLRGVSLSIFGVGAITLVGTDAACVAGSFIAGTEFDCPSATPPCLFCGDPSLAASLEPAELPSCTPVEDAGTADSGSFD